MGMALDLTGATNRRNLAALQRRRDWEALAVDLERVLGDYRSVIESIANSEADNVKRAIQGTSQQASRDALIEAFRQELGVQSGEAQRASSL
ncbi:MAG: hypothetical protein LC777_01240 [Actinobacteria bacterium]|nr:hypothetical protein [Actinomycetota bacterium]